jgi:hypothetical protein
VRALTWIIGGGAGGRGRRPNAEGRNPNSDAGGDGGLIVHWGST